MEHCLTHLSPDLLSICAIRRIADFEQLNVSWLMIQKCYEDLLIFHSIFKRYNTEVLYGLFSYFLEILSGRT